MRVVVRLAVVLGTVSALCACSAILGDFTVGTVPVGSDAGDAANDTLPTVDGSDTGVPDSSPPPPQATILSVAAGAAHTCATVTYDALVKTVTWCWGSNATKQLGSGSTAAGFTRLDTQGHVFNVLRSSSTANHTCALDGARDVWCWGDNSAYQSGNTNGGMVDLPTLVATTYQNHVDLTVGGAFTCAVTATNKLVCWGDNTHCIINPACTGRFGPTSGTPGGFASAVSLISLNAGAAFACAVAKNGGPAGSFCWGASAQWQINNGGADLAGALQEPWADVLVQGVGESQVCLQHGAEFRCWGNNVAGQANGAPNSPPKIDPSMAPSLAFPDVKASAVAGGTGFTCGISGGRDAYCWGDNSNGQLGIAKVGQVAGFQKVVGLKDVQSIAAGGAHACAVAHDLTETSSDPFALYCWGNNMSSQVDPLGQKSAITKPVRVSFPPYQ